MRIKLLIVLLFVIIGTVYGAEMTFVDSSYTASLDNYDYILTSHGYIKMGNNVVLNTTETFIGNNIYVTTYNNFIYTVSVFDSKIIFGKFNGEKFIFKNNITAGQPVYPELAVNNNVNIAFFDAGQQRIKYVQFDASGNLITNPAILSTSKDQFDRYSIQHKNLTVGVTESLFYQTSENTSGLRIRYFGNNNSINLSLTENFESSATQNGMDVFNVTNQNLNFHLTAVNQSEAIRIEISEVPRIKPTLLPYSFWPQLIILPQSHQSQENINTGIIPSDAYKIEAKSDVELSLASFINPKSFNVSSAAQFLELSINTTQNNSGRYKGTISYISNTLYANESIVVFVDWDNPVINNLMVNKENNLIVNVNASDDSDGVFGDYKDMNNRFIGFYSSLWPDANTGLENNLFYNYTLYRNGQVYSSIFVPNNTHSFSNLQAGGYNLTVQVMDATGKRSWIKHYNFNIQSQISITNVKCENNALTISIKNEGDEIISSSEQLTIYRVLDDSLQTISINYLLQSLGPGQVREFRTPAPCETSQISTEYSDSYALYNYTMNVNCSSNLNYNGCGYNSSEDVYLINLDADWRGGSMGRFRWDPSGDAEGPGNWSHKESSSRSFSKQVNSVTPSNIIYLDVLNSVGGVECSNDIVVHCVSQTERVINMSYNFTNAVANFLHDHLLFTEVFGGHRLYHSQVNQLVANSADIAEDSQGFIQVSHENRTGIITSIEYTGPDKDYVILLQNLTKDFAQNVDSIIVQTPGTAFVVKEDPKYAIVFEDVESGDNLDVSYYAGEVKDINASDIRGPMLFVYDSGQTVTTSTSSTTTSSTTTMTTFTTTTTYRTGTTSSTTTTTYSPPTTQGREEDGFPIFLVIVIIILIIIGIIGYMFKERIIFFIKYITAG